MSNDIAESFSGRSIFITGGTGFVGKVLIYQLFNNIPNIKSVYLLCRAKKSRVTKKVVSAQERINKDILESPCFDSLRKRLGKDKWAELCSCVKAVNGDITLDGLGLSAADREELTNNVELIVHLAATVNFNEKLNLAVQMNTLGGLRVLSLAKKCKKLEAMVHCSTCYVNYSRQGRDNVNKEEIYPLDFDPEMIVKQILTLHEEEVEVESKKLLKKYNFPNTYTFTKNLGEQLIQKHKENVPVVIVRPSIIGAALRDPCPGWVDALTAAGGILLTVALGVVRELNLGKDLLADVVPVDSVVNVIIKALFHKQQDSLKKRELEKNGISRQVTPGSAALSTSGKGVPLQKTGHDMPFIFQVATSNTSNALSWGRMYFACETLMNGAPKKHPKALSRCDVFFTTNTTLFQIRFNALRYMPYLALRGITALPEPIGNPDRRKAIFQLGRAVHRAEMLNREFHLFILNEWVYETSNSFSLDKGLSEKSKNAFPFDPADIDWYGYVQHYVYGLLKYIVKDVGSVSLPPPPGSGVEVFQRASHL